MQTLTITQPDDWHLHVRDGETLCDVLSATSRSFACSIIMPNLQPSVTTVELMLINQQRAWQVSEHYPLGEHHTISLRAGESVAWQQA